MRISKYVAAVLVCLLAGPVLAHKASTSYLHIEAANARVQVRWDVAIRDLDYALALDANGDSEVTWGELETARPRIADYLLTKLTVSSVHQCPLTLRDMKVVEHSDGAYAVMYFDAPCAGAERALDVDYRLLFDIDALHRGLAEIVFERAGGAVERRSALFAPDAHLLHFTPDSPAMARVFAQYFKAGLFHVWSGLDHMLFLAGLFLPAVLRREHGRWHAVDNLRTALKDTAFIVTAFTLAHACTLTLAATGAFTLPARLVESAVALTVLFAGLNNLIPMVYRGLFWLSAGFGLIHGAAVASALIDLGLPAQGRVWALLAFNVGVEAAQLTLLLAVIVPSYVARNTRAYRRYALIPGSALVATVGLCWFVERAFAVNLHIPLP